MLRQIAEGVHVHVSEFMQSNAAVVEGRDGVLLIDPGVHEHEMAAIAQELSERSWTVVAGFSTHPHWDHLLWHSAFGSAPRYGTARCAATIQGALSNEGFKARLAQMVPAEIYDQLPLQLLGQIESVPAEAAEIPWDGPRVRVFEHQGHAAGHAALLIEQSRVLVAGDMLSDILIPFLNLMDPTDQVEAYLTGLQQIEDLVGDVDVFIPGHGSVGRGDELRARIEQDRSYVHALRDGGAPSDPRLSPTAYGKDFLSGVHDRQVQCCGPRV